MHYEGMTLSCGCIVGMYYCKAHYVPDMDLAEVGEVGTWYVDPSAQNGYDTVRDSPYEDGYHPSDRSCTCHLGHPPCSYCTDGGYCKDHDCMRYECGCEA